MNKENERQIISQVPYKYTFEKYKEQYIFSIHQAVGIGRDVIEYLTEKDFISYTENPDVFIQQKIKQLEENPEDYKICWWR